MNGGIFAKCARIPTTRGIRSPAHINPRCKTPATRSRRVNLVSMFSSNRPERREHRQNDASDERRREQQKGWSGGDDDRKNPSAKSLRKPQCMSELSAFCDDTQALEHEVSGGEAVAAMRRQ